MTSSSVYRLLLSTPGEMLAALPLLLDHTPADSFVFIGLDAQRGLVGAARCDTDASQAREAVRGALGTLMREGARAILVFVIHPLREDGELPYRDTVGETAEDVRAMGMQVVGAFWTPRVQHRAQWRNYFDPTDTGLVADPYAARFTGLSETPTTLSATRDELAASYGHAVGEPVLRVRKQRIERTETDPALLREAFGRAVGSASKGQWSPGEVELVALAQALASKPIRDAAIRYLLDERAGAAELVLTYLVRHLPAPYRCSPALLFMMLEASQRSGPRASILFEIARESDPENSLVQIFQQMPLNSFPPQVISKMLSKLTKKEP
ncbi:DUF4192 domain-containing protein [Sciscionella marina]|uniref:DUF4192 domain-containing protein n=1 Tax=Sciscionella marina TaxID=508770 RepID=UPI000A027546|nr:DUF4192 domain-containing protein [Sciscionella marina]